MTAEQILAKAAEYVEASWSQDKAELNGFHGGPYCAGTALMMAALTGGALTGGVDSCLSDSYLAAGRAFCREIGVASFGEVFAWHDAPERCQAEVASRLRDAKRWLS